MVTAGDPFNLSCTVSRSVPRVNLQWKGQYITLHNKNSHISNKDGSSRTDLLSEFRLVSWDLFSFIGNFVDDHYVLYYVECLHVPESFSYCNFTHRIDIPVGYSCNVCSLHVCSIFKIVISKYEFQINCFSSIDRREKECHITCEGQWTLPNFTRRELQCQRTILVKCESYVIILFVYL